MGQDNQNKNIACALTVSFLIGLLCGCMMLMYQNTQQAVAIKTLLTEQWAALQVPQSEEHRIAEWFLRLFLPTAIMQVITFGFGLWLIGQPFLIGIHAAAGVLCGGYGAILLQENLWLFLLGYLPFVTIVFWLQLPIGVSGFRCSFSASKRLKGCLLLLMRQMVLLGILCLAAALIFIRYGAQITILQEVRFLP